MIIKKADFVITAVEPSGYPETGWPEIALAGRSNVGKSSVINSLVNRKSLARVGGTPGKTRVINFYNVNDSLLLVDLPGYGYAKVSKEEKKSWGKLAETYLTTRGKLRVILLLVDIRHGPSDDDAVMLEFIKASGRKFVIIATKADKIKRSEYKKHIEAIRESLQLTPETDIIPFSALKHFGAREVWDNIEALLI